MIKEEKILIKKLDQTNSIRMNFANFINNTKDKLFIISIGSCIWYDFDGYYTTVLKCNNKIKVINGAVKTNSAYVCILTGILAAIDCIKRPTDVYIVTSTSLGFATRKSVNRDLCVSVRDELKKKKCSAQLIELLGKGDELNQYVKLLSQQ